MLPQPLKGRIIRLAEIFGVMIHDNYSYIFLKRNNHCYSKQNSPLGARGCIGCLPAGRQVPQPLNPSTFPHKPIPPLLGPHSRCLAMSRINHRFIRQRIKLSSDTIFQHFKTSAREIGATNAALEQYIAADDKSAGLMVKRDGSG